MKIDNFFAELKRRNVYKVAVAYLVAGWALAQGRRAGSAGLQYSELGHSVACRAHHTGSSGCARAGLGVRVDAGGTEAHGNSRRDAGGDAKEEIRLDLCRRDRRRNFAWIIFSRSLLGCPRAKRSGKRFGKVDRSSAV